MAKYNCPVCGGGTKKRQSYRGGVDFYGCKDWRKCGRLDTEGKPFDPALWERLNRAGIELMQEGTDDYILRNLPTLYPTEGV